MSGSVTNQRKVNNVQAGCAQSLLTNPQPQSELPDQWGQGAQGGVLSRVVMVHPLSCHARLMWMSVSLSSPVQVMTEDISQRNRTRPGFAPFSRNLDGATGWKSEAEIFYDKTLHWQLAPITVCCLCWALIIGDVDSDSMHYVCIYLIAESVVCCNV